MIDFFPEPCKLFTNGMFRSAWNATVYRQCRLVRTYRRQSNPGERSVRNVMKQHRYARSAPEKGARCSTCVMIEPEKINEY